MKLSNTLMTGMFVMIALVSCVTNSSNPPEIMEEKNTPKTIEQPINDTKPKTPNIIDGKMSLSLKQCVQIALENNRDLLITREEKTKANGRLKEANASLYPSINANLSYTRIDEISKIDMGGVSIVTGSLNNYKAAVSVNQYLYQGGRIDAMIDSAKIGQQLADAQFSDVHDVIIYQTVMAYYNTLLNKEIININQKSLANAVANLDSVKLLNQQGMASSYELLRAQVQVSNIKASVIQSESNLKLTKLSLIRIMGLQTDDRNMEIELTEQINYKPQEINLPQALDTAFQLRADLKQAKLMVDLQKKNIEITKAGLRPSLLLFANAGEEKPSSKSMGLIEWDNYWNTGAMVSFPLFEGGQTQGKVIQERATLNQKEITLRDTEEKIHYEIKQAILSLKDAEELINSQKENVKQAEEGLRLANIGFKNGVNTQLEVMDTQLALDVARKNYLSAIYSYNFARLMLEKAMGVLGTK